MPDPIPATNVREDGCRDPAQRSAAAINTDVPGLLDRCEAMLVLSRKIGERILIGDSVRVTVVRIANGAVRLGIEAPVELPVVREELKAELDAADAKSPAADDRR